MPNRNSINKPKDSIIRNKHAQSIGKKWSSRKNALTTSSSDRYSTKKGLKPKPSESNVIALYNKQEIENGSKLTTKTVSKKRAKKLERNKKYVLQRNENLGIDILAKKEQMDVVEDQKPQDTSSKDESVVAKAKKMIWSVVSDNSSSGLKFDSTGEGTTLGLQAF